MLTYIKDDENISYVKLLPNEPDIKLKSAESHAFAGDGEPAASVKIPDALHIPVPAAELILPPSTDTLSAADSHIADKRCVPNTSDTTQSRSRSHHSFRLRTRFIHVAAVLIGAAAAVLIMSGLIQQLSLSSDFISRLKYSAEAYCAEYFAPETIFDALLSSAIASRTDLIFAALLLLLPLTVLCKPLSVMLLSLRGLLCGLAVYSVLSADVPMYCKVFFTLTAFCGAISSILISSEAELVYENIRFRSEKSSKSAGSLRLCLIAACAYGMCAAARFAAFAISYYIAIVN